MRLSNRLARAAGEGIAGTIDRCFEGLEDVPGLLLAVSGGPDSMALMHMAAAWARGRDRRPSLHVATVDHGLRPESRREAELVAAAAADLGLPHAILDWAGPKPTSRIQEKARAARYGLLAARARAVGATHVLTAHHADDQAETVLLRLGRGSGIAGLAGMRRRAPLAADVQLARPLLGVTKAELVEFCRARAIAFVDDPSNHDQVFARAKLRAHAKVLASLGFDTSGLARLAQRMARADDALEAEAERRERVASPVRAAGHYEADLAAAADAPPEIALRLLRRAIEHVAGTAPPRLDRLEALSDAVWAALRAGAAHRATLGGTRVMLDTAGRLAIVFEAPRRRGLRRIDAA